MDQMYPHCVTIKEYVKVMERHSFRLGGLGIVWSRPPKQSLVRKVDRGGKTAEGRKES